MLIELDGDDAIGPSYPAEEGAIFMPGMFIDIESPPEDSGAIADESLG
jgi:hypothetical protein